MKHRFRALTVFVLCLVLGGYALLRSNRATLTDWLDARQLSPEQLLCDRLSQGAQRIDLLPYQLEPDGFFKLWNKARGEHPELFYVSPNYTFSALGDRVLSVYPEYGLPAEEAREARLRYARILETVAAGVDPDWTELETALYLHDWLALNAKYDETLEYYTAYDLLTAGEGVCQAYAHAYMALLRQCGMDCHYVTSEEMNHAWVIVSIDGAWYNVDVTHDDPVTDRLGHVQHTFFLKSDAAIAGTHYGGDAPFPCTSTAYDDAVWEDVETAFIPLGGVFYCISGNQLCRWEENGLTPLYTIQDRWYTSSAKNAYWDGCFSVLDADGFGLLYSTPNALMCYDPAVGDVRRRYTYDGPGAIYGFTWADGVLTLQISQDPNTPGIYQTLSL